MIHLTIAPHDELEWLGENPAPDTFTGEQHPLWHQWQTAQATTPIVINSYNTGTGKTKAAALRLLQRTRERQGRLDRDRDNVLFIAPTNELLAQHARDLEAFCTQNALPYRIQIVTRAEIDILEQMMAQTSSGSPSSNLRHTVFTNPLSIDHDTTKEATIYVINPDIWYYALYFLYNRRNRIQLFQDLFTQCNLIILDELHYYTYKQLANFLFFIKLSQFFGYIDGSTQRQFILLTATPEPRVIHYLQQVGVPVTHVDPTQLMPADTLSSVAPVRALAPIDLDLWSTETMKSPLDDATGIIALVDHYLTQIKTWLAEGKYGVIISSSLWCVEHIYQRLRQAGIPDEVMGRITGPESRAGRRTASQQQLIIATPTVDIGYNFEHGTSVRQNVDFLLFDARTSDEFLQRLGRAGRVLGKRYRDIPSHVMVVAPPKLHEDFSIHHNQTINRAVVRTVALAALPLRNELAAYMKSGAIIESFRPLYNIAKMMPQADQPEIIALCTALHDIFGANTKMTYQRLMAQTKAFDQQEEAYEHIVKNPDTNWPILQRFIAQETRDEPWITKVMVRLQTAKKAGQITAIEMVPDWLDRDIRRYVVEQARFAFRDAFQGPQVLIADPHRILSSESVCVDDALRIACFYEATFYLDQAEWERQTGESVPVKMSNVHIFCLLRQLRPVNQRVRCAFRLQTHETAKEWETRFAYQMTAIRHLALYAPDGQQFPLELCQMLSSQFVPVVMVRIDSLSGSALLQLKKRTQITIYPLKVSFARDLSQEYWMVLGTPALLVAAELHSTFSQNRARLHRDSVSDHVEDYIF